MNTSEQIYSHVYKAFYDILSFNKEIIEFNSELEKKKEKADGNASDLKEINEVIQRLVKNRTEIVNTCNARKIEISDSGNSDYASKYCSMERFWQLMRGYKSFYATSETREKCRKICCEAVNFINDSIKWNESEKKKKADVYISEYNSALKEKEDKINEFIKLLQSHRSNMECFERNHMVFEKNIDLNNVNLSLGYTDNSYTETTVCEDIANLVNDFVAYCHSNTLVFNTSNYNLKLRMALSIQNPFTFEKNLGDLSRTSGHNAFLINNYLIEKRSTEKDCADVISKGLEAFILNILSANRNDDFEIILADPVSNGSDFCDILDLFGDNGIDKIYYTKQEIRDVLEELSQRVISINNKIKSAKTIYHYNAENPNDRIKQVFFIGYNVGEEYYDSAFMKSVIENSQRCGFSIILIKDCNSFNEATDKLAPLVDYKCFNRINVLSSTRMSYKIYSSSDTPFFFSGLPDNYVEFIEEYKAFYFKSKQSEKDKVKNEYISLYSFDELPEYSKKYKPVILPFGVEEDGSIRTISFEKENFAAYLVGASQSGKTTLIHTLIAGIIRNYHPDNVELWLADFKQLEFKCYMDNTPPHIKCILLDESKELICDLIDRINNELMRRQQILSRMGKLRLEEVDYSVLEEPLPVIFIIFDEFSIMSQVISELPEYKLKLQNVLAKGAALGFKFLFSSQSFSSGVSGLTLAARNQIQQRIAMKVKREEIIDTLELPNELKTEQVNHWINTLSPHYALIKSRVENGLDTELSVKKEHVLYIEDYGKRNNMIEHINNKMQCSDNYYFEKTNQFVNKHPVFVDGNTYHKFNSEEFSSSVANLGEDRTYFEFGNPRLISNTHKLSVTNETRENVLLLSQLDNTACAASIILSVIKQCVIQNVDVELWAYSKNRIYIKYKELFALYGATVYEDMNAVCSRIYSIKNNVQNRTEKKTFVILLGMDRICADFDYYEIYNSSSPIHDKNEGILEEDSINNQQKVRMKLVEKIIELDSDSSLLEEEKSRIISDYQAELEKEYGISNEPNGVVAEREVADADNNEDYSASAYDASKDFSYIIKNGSRLDYHFMLCLNTVADLKQMRSKGIQLDLFRHRLAFNLSTEDSIEVFRSRIASTLPQHICQYDDTMNGFSFRPFLHYGIEWDGWSVDEKDNVINPYKSINA